MNEKIYMMWSWVINFLQRDGAVGAKLAIRRNCSDQVRCFLAQNPRTQRIHPCAGQASMKVTLTSILLLVGFVVLAQQTRHFSLLLQAEPELTFYQNDYTHETTQTGRASFNAGIQTSVRYEFAGRWFTEAGIAFKSRKLKTRILGNTYEGTAQQTIMIYQDYSTKSITHRLLQLPVTIGYKILQKSKTNVFLTAGAVPRLDLNTQYKLSNFESVHTGGWQGFSVNAGGGIDHTLTRHLAIAGSLSFAVWNKVPRDNNVRDEFTKGEVVKYNYLEAGLGVKWRL